MKRNIKIKGIGTFLPKRLVKAEDIDQLFSTKSGWSERKSGVKQRYFVEDETASLYQQFEKNILDGKDLTFADDDGIEYTVMFSSDNFGISDRQTKEEVYWSGTINLEEV